MTEAVSRICATREQAHAAAADFYAGARMLIQDGRRAEFILREYEDDISARQRGFLHKAVLTQISEQARGVNGERYRMEVWKELFRAQFLGSEWEIVNGKPVEIRRSTESLGVKAYSHYIDQVIADAATNWGVAFRFIAEERDAVRYQPKAKRLELETA